MKTSRNQHVYVFRKWNEKLFIPKSVIFLRYRSRNCHRLFTPTEKRERSKKLWHETETPCCAEICRFVTRCQYRNGYQIEYLHRAFFNLRGEQSNNYCIDFVHAGFGYNHRNFHKWHHALRGGGGNAHMRVFPMTSFYFVLCRQKGGGGFEKSNDFICERSPWENEDWNVDIGAIFRGKFRRED